MVTINALQIIWNFWDIVYPAHNDDYIPWTLSIFGFSNGFSDMFLLVLIPISLADKNRVLAYELTMIGTIFALLNLTFYIGGCFTAGFTVEVIR